jgi:hypothetical protein
MSQRPIALSDEAMSMLLRLAQPLSPADRGVFLEAVADELRAYSVIGDGLIMRVAATKQRRYLEAPHVARAQSKWARRGGGVRRKATA